MKKAIACLGLLRICFGYEMDLQICQGTWTIVDETADSKTVLISGDTTVEIDHLQLEAGQNLTIIQEDEGRIFFVMHQDAISINGSIHANCPIEFQTEGDLTFGKTALIKAPDRKITIHAQQLQVMDESQIDTSGNDGGKIVIHADEIIQQSQALISSAGCSTAGSIFFITKNAPQLFGVVSVESQAGQGGTVTICCESGKPVWDQLRMKGPLGTGTLVFDPKNVLIQAGGLDSATGNTFGSNPSGDVVIDGATLSTAIDAASVIIQANTDITVNDQITGTTSGNGLTLQAGRSIALQKGCILTLNNADFSAIINDEGAVSNRDAGTAIFSMAADSHIITHGGNITIDAGTFGLSQEGQTNIKSAILDAGGGQIAITGMNAVDANMPGIVISKSICATSGLGTMTFTGTGSSAGFACYGTFIDKSILSGENGKIQINGFGGGAANTGNTYNYGIVITGGEVSTSGTGDIELMGIGGNGENRNHAVIIGSRALVKTIDGAINVATAGGGTLDHNYGFRIEGSSVVEATGTGTVSIDGNGGGGGAFNIGLSITSKNTRISVADGNMTLDGTGGGGTSNNAGLTLDGYAIISSTGLGTLTINGESLNGGTEGNIGIICGGKYTNITAQTGDIFVTGIGHGSGNLNEGVRFESAFSLSATGSANITINGTGGLGPKANNGFEIDAAASVTAFDGDINCTGTALVKDTLGIYPPNPTNMTSTNGSVTLVSNDG